MLALLVLFLVALIAVAALMWECAELRAALEAAKVKLQAADELLQVRFPAVEAGSVGPNRVSCIVDN